MKLRLTTIENKCFVTLVGMFNMYCSSLFFFSQSSICALFSIVFLHCSYSVFHCCSSTVPFWLALFFFFPVFCLYFYFPFIYITIHPVFLHCECTIAAIVLWFREFLFFFLPFIQPFCLFNWHYSYNA